jgi:hypothetical protein
MQRRPDRVVDVYVHDPRQSLRLRSWILSV